MRYYDYSDCFGPSELLNPTGADLPAIDPEPKRKTNQPLGVALVAVLYVFGLGSLAWGTVKMAESSVALNQYALSSGFVLPR